MAWKAVFEDMEKRSVELLLVLVACCVFSSMSNATPTSCPKVGGAVCSDAEDETIMECCLKRYKLGFDTLPDYIPGQDPPSCKVDEGLAKCLSESKCFGKPLTGNLRLLILNQLVFTNRVGLCVDTIFTGFLEEAKKNSRPESLFRKALKNIKDMDRLPPDSCATVVYGICGLEFKNKLQEQPGYDADKLCEVFDSEKDCIIEKAASFHCDSKILTRFKANSNSTAAVVLNAICPH